MRDARALPTDPLMPATGSLSGHAATPLVGGPPGKIERSHPFGSPPVEHPIDHHVAGSMSVDLDKAGRRHAPLVPRTTFPHRRQQMT